MKRNERLSSTFIWMGAIMFPVTLVIMAFDSMNEQCRWITQNQNANIPMLWFACLILIALAMFMMWTIWPQIKEMGKKAGATK
jgi:NADH:ubiquinone oxidoreductase subunit 6 (subunit J)